MNKYIKFYRSISSAEVGLCENKQYIRKAPLIFGRKEVKQIITIANENRRYFRDKKLETKQRLFELILKREKPHFKTHCVECGRAILPINHPKKIAEYEERGNYCSTCHNKANKNVGKDFYSEDIATTLGLWWKPKKKKQLK